MCTFQYIDIKYFFHKEFHGRDEFVRISCRLLTLRMSDQMNWKTDVYIQIQKNPTCNKRYMTTLNVLHAVTVFNEIKKNEAIYVCIQRQIYTLVR